MFEIEDHYSHFGLYNNETGREVYSTVIILLINLYLCLQLLQLYNSLIIGVINILINRLVICS